MEEDEVGFIIDDPETEALIEAFAAERGVGLEEAIRLAVNEALEVRGREKAGGT